MYELVTCKPHEPADARFTVAEWDLYAAGYRTALVMALKVMEHAEVRYALYLRTRRLEAKQRKRDDA